MHVVVLLPLELALGDHVRRSGNARKLVAREHRADEYFPYLFFCFGVFERGGLERHLGLRFALPFGVGLRLARRFGFRSRSRAGAQRREQPDGCGPV